jgi:dihydroflavonol-4-reductase
MKWRIEMTETVLVTGGTGFVAGWCIVDLLQRGYAVRTTVRDAAKERAVRAAVSSEFDPGDRLTCHVADLMSDDGWDAAVAGCDYVLHVASPMGTGNPKDPDELIVPARSGAVRVLAAATRAEVKRVVLTSSCAAATPSAKDTADALDETVWTDTDDTKLDAYRKSKAIAERAAWQFMADNPGPTTLTTVLPGAIFGPVLSAAGLGSVQVIGRMLQGRMPGSPRIGLEVVDVRDVADLHIRAMTSQAAAGERFIAVNEFLWMADVARELRAKLGASASKVPTRTLPDIALRAMSVFDPSVRAITPMLGRKFAHTSAKAQRELGWRPRPAGTTVVDCAESLIARNAL